MSKDFHLFSKAVHQQLQAMGDKLFVVDVEDIFASYLAAFPEGSNPIFRTNTEHDCSCCKQFIRNLGKVVAFDRHGARLTVWDDFDKLPQPYLTVAHRLADLVRQAPIAGVYKTKEGAFGAETTRELTDDGTVINWSHFHGEVPRAARSQKPDEDRGRINTKAHVFKRGLETISIDDLDTVIDLIENNGLYRGTEHLASVKEFRTLRRGYEAAPDREAFVWANCFHPSAPFRNTVIGTLLVDLADTGDLEGAVKRFESKVAPHNYKRPKALITPKMVEQAVQTLRDLDLEHAVERRFAKIGDVSVNDVLWVDNSVQGKMKGGIEGLLLGEAKRQQPADFKALEDRAVKISIANFLRDVVPTATSIELALTNAMLGNFVSLTAPVHESTGRLFKWNNDFAWSYDGEVADSIAARVKTAGGNIDAALRVSLAWDNLDDLDLHCKGPDGHIHYANKMGILDVDMNVTSPRRGAVENLAWQRPRNGTYRITVNNFTRRGGGDDGFTIELAHGGGIDQFTAVRSPGWGRDHEVLRFTYSNGQLLDLKVSGELTGGSRATDKWGVTTGQLVPVDTLLRSPNHWEGQSVGNLHWFFILAGCKNPDETRGIYNEFLRGDLDKHRKVFEVLGSKAKCPPSDEQLSGVGFSSTKKERALFVVNNNRAYEVEF